MMIGTQNRMLAAIASAVVVLGLAASPAMAGKGNKKKPDFPEFKEVTKDMKTVKGFFTLYHNKKDDKLFASIPGSMLNKTFLLALSVSRGPTYAGWQMGDAPVYWERMGKKLVLMEADTRYVEGKGSTVGDVIERTYTDSIITSVPILTENGGDVVIDIGKLFKSDMAGMSGMFGGSLRSDLSRIGAFKNFEHNTEIGMDLAMVSRRGGGPIVRLHYSLSRLATDNGYKSRKADDRIGYFLVVKKDWTTDHSADTVFNRYISRWRLRKAEPDKKVSDVKPSDQIIFYLEKTIPVKYRRHVREGILEWNKAFEKAGIRDAIAVYQQTDKVHADKDPEDIRYNFIRWIVSGTPFAMGPSRVNPFTGQILDADIIMDDSMVRWAMQGFDVYGPKAALPFTDAPVAEFIAHHPDWSVGAPGHDGDWMTTSEAATQEPRPTPAAWLNRDTSHSTCELGIGMVRQMSLAGMLAIKSGAGGLSDEFIGQAIKETIMHEVGHTLGLRHNFKGSSWRPLSELMNDGCDSDKPTTASVMDYNPYVYGSTEDEQSRFVTPTLGPYDYWAIAYGYQDFMADPDDEDAPKNEADMLVKCAARCADAGLAYATDEDTSYFYPDPQVNRWDAGDDPVAYARQQTALMKSLWKDGMDWAVENGESRSRARRVFSTLLSRYGSSVRFAARLVGGQSINRYHKGDAEGVAPIGMISASKQREALRFLGGKALGDKSFQFSPELLNSLGAGRWGHWDSDGMDRDVPYDLHRRILSIQSGVLFQLLNPFTINRVYDGALQAAADEDVLTVPELFRTVSGLVWSELDDVSTSGVKHTARKPMISSFRRSLQRNHAERMIQIVLSQPGQMLYPDAHAVARLTLKDLAVKIDKALAVGKKGMDGFTRAHLVDARQRIRKAIDAKFEVRTARSAARRRSPH